MVIKYACMAEYLSWSEGPAHTRYVGSSSLPSATIFEAGNSSTSFPLFAYILPDYEASK